MSTTDKKAFKNTFAPHVENEELYIEDIVAGMPLGVFSYDTLPEEVKKALDKWVEENPPEDDD